MVVRSYIFDFQRTPRFFEEWNIKFKVLEMMTNSNLFQIVYCDVAPTNIEECLDGGVLKTSAINVLATVDCSLKYNDGVITMRNDAIWNIGNNTKTVKAVFIRHKESGFVMGYSINNTAFDVTNRVIIDSDTILWSIVDG